MNTLSQCEYFCTHTTHNWYNHCLGFVCAAWGVPVVHYDATQAFYATKYRGTGYYPAAGALCWWTGGSAGHGHVAVSAGGGYCWTSDFGPNGYIGDGRIRKVLISSIHQHDSILYYKGWSRDLEGHVVIAAPKALPTVSLSKLQSAARTDPSKPNGYATYPAGTKLVQAALHAEGLLPTVYYWGSFGTSVISAYAAWQRRLGYTGSAANGIPGSASLAALGKKHGFIAVS